MLNIFIDELIGTFLFLSIIMATASPVPIAVGLLAGIYFAGGVTSGHLNPAVSLMLYLNGNINTAKLAVYMAAQFLGGIIALTWFKYSGSKKSPVF